MCIRDRDWRAIARAPHNEVLELHRRLLLLRRQWIVPRLAGMDGGSAQFDLLAERALRVSWRLGDGSVLSLSANLGEQAVATAPVTGSLVFATSGVEAGMLAAGHLPPWSVAWHLLEGGAS